MAELSDLDWSPLTLKVYLERVISEHDRRYAELREADQLAVRKAEDSAREAISTAKTEANDRLTAHNGLLQKMESQAATFALRETSDERFSRLEQWQSKMIGGIVVIGAIGVANLVKLWS